MAATNNQTLTFDDVLSMTVNEHRQSIANNLYRESALLNALTKGGAKETLEGGARIIEPLLVTAPGGFQSYSGTDTFDTTINQTHDAAQFEWSQVGGAIGITGTQEIQNSGKHAVVKLMKAKIETAELALRDAVNIQLASDGTGNGGKDIGGLKLIVSTTAQSVGGLSETTYSRWAPVRTYAGSGAVTAFGSSQIAATGGYYAMLDTYSRCSDGTKRPDLIIGARECWFSASTVLGQNVRYVPDQGERNIWAGWDVLLFMGAKFVTDRTSDSNGVDVMGTYANDDAKIYFLNTKTLKFYVNSKRNFIVEPFQKPVNQDARWSQLLVACQLTCNDRRANGVMEVQAAA